MQQQNEDIEQLSGIFHQLRDAEPIQTIIDADAAFLLVCQLQLALRHPLNNGDGAQVIRQMATQLEARLSERVPEAVAQLEKGWHPEFDVQVELTYEDLSIHYQEEVLANSFALHIACNALSKITQYPIEQWSSEIAQAANQLLNNYDEEKVRAEIKQIVETRQEVIDNHEG